MSNPQDSSQASGSESKPLIRLSFASAHRSIRSLEPVELPSFSVITGINGSGKTHLLEAIDSGKIRVAGLQAGKGQIRLFNWSTFVAKTSDTAQPRSVLDQRSAAAVTVLTKLEESRNRVRQVIQRSNISGDPKILDDVWLLTTEESEMRDVLKKCTRDGTEISEVHAQQYAQQVVSRRESALQQAKANLTEFGSLWRSLLERAKDLGTSPLLLPNDQVRELMPLIWTPADALQFQFAQWFTAWHITSEHNKYSKYQAAVEKEVGRKYIEHEEFIRRYGREPWEIANETLRVSNIRFQFNQPRLGLTELNSEFRLELRDPNDGTVVSLSELSSGEQTILAITILLFQTDGEEGLLSMPKLLLLDEVDAHLHPSFTKTLFDVLHGEIHKRHNVSVILTTHSPSTVALAPPGSVFELSRDPRYIRPVSSSRATQMLSSGYVSLTTSDTIVITEASNDARYYQAVFTAMSCLGKVRDRPQLRFIPASESRDDGKGGGVAQVRNWSSKLADLKIERFRGLIDRDRDNRGDGTVEVIDRCTLENYFCDPLSLVAFFLHNDLHLVFTKRDLRPNCDTLKQLDQRILQELVDGFVSWFGPTTGMPESADGSRIVHRTIGFPDVSIPEWWYRHPGKQILNRSRDEFNRLSPKASLGAKVSDFSTGVPYLQIRLLPELLSKELAEVFTKLQLDPA